MTKREYLALQELGENLIALSDSELASLSFHEKIESAIRDAGQIKSRGALRRQKRLIGKLMRDVDPQPIRAELAKMRADDVRVKRIFARAKRWRDQIVSGGMNALKQFEAETGEADTELRVLLSELNVAISDRVEKTVRRQIFRRVHEILVRIL